MACCEGLVCGFPIIRGSAFEQQAGHAFNQPTAEQLVHNADTGVDKPMETKDSNAKDSSSNKITAESGSSSNRRSMKSDKKQQEQQQQASGGAVFESGSADVAALGPSCRPLPEVDLVTGVVNYGC
jgi:hypothetical protein